MNQENAVTTVELTAAAYRAMAEGARWSDCPDRADLDGPAILLGLLAESECRAAVMLAAHGVTIETVRRRWPELAPRATTEAEAETGRLRVWRFSPDARSSLDMAATWLADRLQPPELGTEHVLLGLASVEHDVGLWLQGQGLDRESLEDAIRRVHAHLPQIDPDAYPETVEPTDLDLAESLDPSVWPDLDTLGGPMTEGDEIRVLRVVDAAANRAREGLRVVEDFVRFVLDDRHLTGLLKQLRHDLTAATAAVALEGRLAARETQADVGTELATDAERERRGVGDVLTANFTRLQESLRSLEEFGKLIDPDMAAVVEQLRYRTYTLHRAVAIAQASRQRLAHSRLYVLIDGQATIEDFDLLARDLILAGVHVLQLRDKRLDDRELLVRARLLRELTQDSQTLFVVNDRPDLAVLARADGVHVGQEELSVKDARSIVGPRMLVGVSTHSIEQARAAVLNGADYLGVGPTFPSETKQFASFPGVQLIREVASEISLPAFAIGGITVENLPEVVSAGATRVAVSGAITQADNPAAAVGQMLKLLR